MINQRIFRIVTATVLCSIIALPVVAIDQTEPYPLEYFALREVVNNVTISPDGRHVAMLKILTRTGDPILHIYDADDMDKDPFVVDADPMEIRRYYWASDKHIVLTLRQRVRKMVKRQEDSVFSFKIAILDIEKREFDGFDAANPAVENLLVGVPDKIIISEQPGADIDLSIREAYRPRAYYELDLNTGNKKLLIRGRVDLASISFDSDGNPRLALGYEPRDKEYVTYYRDAGEKKWKIVNRFSDDDFSIWQESLLALDDSVPGNFLAKAFNGDDKLGLWSYNTTTMNYEDLLYRRSDVDVVDVVMHSNEWTYPDRVVGVRYFNDNFHVQYFDEIEGATFHQLEQLIPNSHFVTITSRSRDGNSLVARNLGPRDPGTYYLLHNGELKAVGSRQPLLAAERLADVEYKQYEARDGRQLAMFVTMPKGEAPFPTVVMPHGGPHIQEFVIYDEWAQMLANNGYMVVQPQYRMSMGYGKDHFRSAFINGSEAGRKMQDDKDDAALFLVEEGLADPDRMAMYGWSYGGYAALIAASRTPQIYQCTIAGAAVSDYVMAANDSQRRTPSGTSRVWRDVYAYGAVQPVEEAEKVNVPILLIHGSVDSRVLPKQAKVYRKALDKFDKDYKFVELEGADHFYDTLYYEHQIELYESIIDFLQNECGMKDELQASAVE